MKLWLRILRHGLFQLRGSARVLDGAALARLTALVRESEARHGGEIRICIESGLPLSYLRRSASPRERALALFGKLRVWDTEANNGVLVYLLLAEHAIEIVCDRTVARVVVPDEWSALLAQLGQALRAGQFEAGLRATVQGIDALLSSRLAPPAAHAKANELPDPPLRL